MSAKDGNSKPTYKLYSVKEWLSKEEGPSTGSVVAYCGPSPWDVDALAMFLEVSDCHVKARLHKSNLDTNNDFSKKLRTLALVISNFADHIDTMEGSAESKVIGSLRVMRKCKEVNIGGRGGDPVERGDIVHNTYLSHSVVWQECGCDWAGYRRIQVVSFDKCCVLNTLEYIDDCCGWRLEEIVPASSEQVSVYIDAMK